MTIEVQRWDNEIPSNEYEDRNGRYVRYDDIAPLLAELERLRAVNGSVMNDRYFDNLTPVVQQAVYDAAEAAKGEEVG